MPFPSTEYFLWKIKNCYHPMKFESAFAKSITTNSDVLNTVSNFLVYESTISKFTIFQLLHSTNGVKNLVNLVTNSHLRLALFHPLSSSQKVASATLMTTKTKISTKTPTLKDKLLRESRIIERKFREVNAFLQRLERREKRAENQNDTVNNKYDTHETCTHFAVDQQNDIALKKISKRIWNHSEKRNSCLKS